MYCSSINHLYRKGFIHRLLSQAVQWVTPHGFGVTMLTATCRCIQSVSCILQLNFLLAAGLCGAVANDRKISDAGTQNFAYAFPPKIPAPSAPFFCAKLLACRGRATRHMHKCNFYPSVWAKMLPLLETTYECHSAGKDSATVFVLDAAVAAVVGIAAEVTVMSALAE